MPKCWNCGRATSTRGCRASLSGGFVHPVVIPEPPPRTAAAAHVIARNVDLVIHESGRPAVQVRGRTDADNEAIGKWRRLLQADHPPLIVQDAEVNEAEGVTPCPEDDRG